MSQRGGGPPTPPARLELLIRRGAEDEAFELREVSSRLGFVHLRPRRLPQEAWELVEVRSRVAGEHTYILKNAQTERFILLSEQERFLWDHMDGRAQLQDIAAAYVMRYGEFDFAIIPGLIRKLHRARLLEIAPASRLRRALARHRQRPLVRALETTLFGLERVNIASRDVQPFFETLYRFGGFVLFTRPGVLACLGLAVLGGAAGLGLWRELDFVLAGFGGHAVAAVVAVKLLFFATMVAHQLVHGLACVHYRRRVREFGFTFLHGIVPTFYVDVTDIFMASRKARVVTAVSGALVHLLLGALWFLAAAQAPPGFAQAFAAASGIIQWQALALSLYPFAFVELDGYHVFVDLLGVPTLRSDALAYVGALLRGQGRIRRGREEALWVGYVALSTVSVAAFVAVNAWIVARALG